MKSKTVHLLKDHIVNKDICFDDEVSAKITLRKSQLRQLVFCEYGIRSKKSKVIKKYTKRLLNDFLRLLLEVYNEENSSKV